MAHSPAARTRTQQLYRQAREAGGTRAAVAPGRRCRPPCRALLARLLRLSSFLSPRSPPAHRGGPSRAPGNPMPAPLSRNCAPAQPLNLFTMQQTSHFRVPCRELGRGPLTPPSHLPFPHLESTWNIRRARHCASPCARRRRRCCSARRWHSPQTAPQCGKLRTRGARPPAWDPAAREPCMPSPPPTLACARMQPRPPSQP
jgi:hypothetical protein